MKRVQFGCGGNRLEGFTNHDAEVDINKRLPYPDQSVNFVFCEHCLEHTDMAKGFLFMEECHRILKPGGKLRLCVPDISRIADRAHRRDLIVNHGHQAVYNQANITAMLLTAGFSHVARSERAECDSHWKVIGKEKDDLETLRVEAHKAP